MDSIKKFMYVTEAGKYKIVTKNKMKYLEFSRNQ